MFFSILICLYYRTCMCACLLWTQFGLSFVATWVSRHQQTSLTVTFCIDIVKVPFHGWRMLEISIFKPLFMDLSPCQSYWQCKHWPGDNVLWDRMIAISDRFAFRKHQISLSRLHKCTACEMCGFIFHMHRRQHNRYQKCFQGARVCLLSPVFLCSPL